jgi:hypothetical protein
MVELLVEPLVELRVEPLVELYIEPLSGALYKAPCRAYIEPLVSFR